MFIIIPELKTAPQFVHVVKQMAATPSLASGKCFSVQYVLSFMFSLDTTGAHLCCELGKISVFSGV